MDVPLVTFSSHFLLVTLMIQYVTIVTINSKTARIRVCWTPARADSENELKG
jgi:hypothetical protein